MHRHWGSHISGGHVGSLGMRTVTSQRHLGRSIVLRVAERSVLENEKCWTPVGGDKRQQSDTGATDSRKTRTWAEHTAMLRCCRRVRCRKRTCAEQLGSGGTSAGPRAGRRHAQACWLQRGAPASVCLPSPDLPVSIRSRGIFPAFPEKNQLKTHLWGTPCNWEMESGIRRRIREGEEGGFGMSWV